MFEKMVKFLRGIVKKEEQENPSKDTAKERLHLVLMQDRANVSADFLELMKQEIIEVIKKYIEIDENAIDVRLTNKSNEDGSNGAPALYANIPIVNVWNDMKKETINQQERSEYLKQEEQEAEANVQEENINEIEEKNEVDKKSTESNESIENHFEEELDNESIDNNEDNEKAEELSKEVDENSKEETEVKEEVQQHQNNNRPNYNNQKGYYVKQKNKKHKKNNRNYPKRG